ncbi:hypothetical protein C8R46DRAFT_1052918 [Mycena filopes]|nr:hypothetical protein C8R46DRAFT_1052918 [Mycena filopes]
MTNEAQRLIAAEAAGTSTDDFDFSSTVNCPQCGDLIEGSTKVCSACKAAVYCSQKCATAAWKTRKHPRGKTHKELCADNKRHMLRTPAFTAVLLQFPWGRVEKDKTFSVDLVRGRFKVLGAKGFGYWSHRGGPVAHLPGDTPGEALRPKGKDKFTPIVEQLVKTFEYLDGSALLETQHANDRDSWKLEPELIPFLNFSSLWSPPRLATKVEIKDWDSWYSWRRLPKESPAVLLLHYVMSVYWLLVDTLHVANPKAGKPDCPRVQLNIHYIGAEVELNFLPLFGELALLLPYTDIKLTCFGQAVHTIVSRAKTSHPKSLAARASPTLPVYSYTAPEDNGSGHIQVFLHGTADYWTPADADPSSPYGRPDALVAPNAGLASYPQWFPIIIHAHQEEIPFGATEYAEQSAEAQLALFSELLRAEAAQPGSVTRRVRSEREIEAVRKAAGRDWGYKIEMNPFQRPGQRPVPSKMPNAPNGFTVKVVGK